jgi:hypothetical protein
VHGYRNDTRTATQERLTPGGRALSEAIEQPRPWEQVYEKSRIKANGEPFGTYENVAISAGKSNPQFRLLNTGGLVLGPLLLALGLMGSAARIADAAPENRARATFEESGAFIFGLAGGTFGTSGGVSLGTSLVTGLGEFGWIAVGGGPATWLIVGCALVGGIALSSWSAKQGAAIGAVPWTGQGW